MFYFSTASIWEYAPSRLKNLDIVQHHEEVGRTDGSRLYCIFISMPLDKYTKQYSTEEVTKSAL